jgi:hypothetical protein
MALLPLKKPTTCDTVYFGGIDIICARDPASDGLPQMGGDLRFYCHPGSAGETLVFF